jgi:NADH dehydrogenase FAD-containing subunit
MVTLSYRGKTYSRAADKNVQKVSELEASGRLKVMLESDVKEIKPDSVDLSYRGKLLRLKNDAVIVCAGGVLPTPLLKKVGIEVETKFGTA